MKKRFVLFILAFFICFSLFGCHRGKMRAEFVLPEEFDATREYNITFWSKNDSNKEQKRIYNDTITRFNEYYPNIHVEIVAYNDYTAIHKDVQTNIATDTTPNVCITYPDFVATYLEGRNVMVPLDSLIDSPKYGLGGTELKYQSVKKDEVIPKFLNEGKINDICYSLPFVRSSEALYINKTYVESLGYRVPDMVTWDFVWEVCYKAMEEEHPNGLIPFIYKSTDNMMIQVTKQKGYGYTTDNAEVLIFNDGVRSYLKELSTYVEDKLFDTFVRVSYPGNFFNRGRCIFAVDSTAGATWIGSKAPLIEIPKEEVADFETVVRPVPQYDLENPQMISQGPSVCIFNKADPQEVLASWIFAQFLLNTETQMAYAKTEGYVPVTTLAVNDPSYIEYLNSPGIDDDHYNIKIDASKIVLDNINNTFITPVFNGSSRVRSLAGALIEQTVALDKTATDEDINSIFQKMNAQYKINMIKKK